MEGKKRLDSQEVLNLLCVAAREGQVIGLNYEPIGFSHSHADLNTPYELLPNEEKSSEGISILSWYDRIFGFSC